MAESPESVRDFRYQKSDLREVQYEESNILLRQYPITSVISLALVVSLSLDFDILSITLIRISSFTISNQTLSCHNCSRTRTHLSLKPDHSMTNMFCFWLPLVSPVSWQQGARQNIH